jgi:hypothetical protein
VLLLSLFFLCRGLSGSLTFLSTRIRSPFHSRSRSQPPGSGEPIAKHGRAGVHRRSPHVQCTCTPRLQLGSGAYTIGTGMTVPVSTGSPRPAAVHICEQRHPYAAASCQVQSMRMHAQSKQRRIKEHCIAKHVKTKENSRKKKRSSCSTPLLIGIIRALFVATGIEQTKRRHHCVTPTKPKDNRP